MAISASKLRENIYHILDEVLTTGVRVEVRPPTEAVQSSAGFGNGRTRSRTLRASSTWTGSTSGAR